MPDHTNLKGFDDVGEILFSNQLETNLISFFQWALLGKGGFYNITIPTSGVYGGDAHRLRPVADPNYNDGQIWEGYRQDWIWETGVECSRQPIRVSGVYVDGNFKPATGVGTYAHHVDYRYGRVVFDTAIAASSTVTCEYSHRMFNFVPGDAPWWRQFQANSYRVDSASFLQAGSGAWNILAQNRIQLPAVVVQVLTDSRRWGFEVGNLTHTVQQDVLFHIVAEDPFHKKQLHDFICYQQEKRIVAFDKNEVLDDERFGLDAEGKPAVSGLMYPDLVKPPAQGGFGWKQVRFYRFSGSDQQNIQTPYQVACVRGTFEAELS